MHKVNQNSGFFGISGLRRLHLGLRVLGDLDEAVEVLGSRLEEPAGL